VSGCCECPGEITEENLIAINVEREAAYSELVCDPEYVCPGDCAPAYPSNATATCVNEASDRSYCQVVWSTGTDG